MKLLVTGGEGFIGSNFINYWLGKYKNDFIISLDAMTYAANPLTVRYHEEHFQNYKFIKGNICNERLVKKLMKNIDIVVHFAAESHVDRSIKEPDKFLMTNVLGTNVLLRYACESNIKRFHHISTDEVYGSLMLNSRKKFNEGTKYSPNSPYSASKAASDLLVRSYFKTYKLPVTITNCSNNYGPFQFPEKVIPLFITRLMSGKYVPIYGKGRAVRDYLFVEDHCRAIDLVLKRGKVGETYCIGGDSELNTIEVAEIILKMLNKPKNLIKFTKDRPGHDLRYAIDHSKITKELGWKPTVTFKEGIKMTIDWYKKNKDWWKPISKKAEVIANEYLKSCK